MKQIPLFITLVIGQLLFSATIKAADIPDSTTVSKQHYYAAKEQFKGMLSGKEELSYEKAITIVENAYYENEVNLVDFNLLIDFHVQNINRIIEINYDESALQIEQVLHKTEEQQIEEYKNALTNWAIYSYITDTTLFLVNNQLSYHLPYEYSYADPLGTVNWRNTQVFNLLDNKTGNCYALASLFKIFSERLNSEALICTAPGHIYIRHADHKGIYHNVELGSKAFPGTGSLETLTYTTDEATKNGISLRELDLKQSVALNLVYLAKGYAYKFGVKDDDFIMECAELALQYDELNLNAMLLKAEVLEERLIKKDKPIKALQADKTFQEYEKLITHLFDLGYREMPTEMKNLVISRLRKEDSPYPMTNHTPNPFEDLGVKEERYATLSNGLFDEQMLTKPVEQYHRTMFDTKQKKITELVELDTTYNNYPMDLVVFAWGVDPLAHEFPSWSPYVAFADNPLFYIDPDGRAVKPVNEDANLLISASFGSFGVSMEQFASALQISTRNGVIRSNLISSSSGMALDMRGFKKHLKNEGITLNGEQLKDAYNLYSKLQSGDLYEIAVFIKPISAPRIDGGNGQSGTVLVDGVNNSTNVAFGEFSQQFENNPDVIDDKTNEQGYGVLQYKPENPNDPDLSHKGTIIIDATKSSTPSKATETLNKALEDTP
jgi:hypothetical protein